MAIFLKGVIYRLSKPFGASAPQLGHGQSNLSLLLYTTQTTGKTIKLLQASQAINHHFWGIQPFVFFGGPGSVKKNILPKPDRSPDSKSCNCTHSTRQEAETLKGKLVFQPLFFGCYVSFSEGTTIFWTAQWLFGEEFSSWGAWSGRNGVPPFARKIPHMSHLIITSPSCGSFQLDWFKTLGWLVGWFPMMSWA